MGQEFYWMAMGILLAFMAVGMFACVWLWMGHD